MIDGKILGQKDTFTITWEDMMNIIYGNTITTYASGKDDEVINPNYKVFENQIIAPLRNAIEQNKVIRLIHENIEYSLIKYTEDNFGIYVTFIKDGIPDTQYRTLFSIDYQFTTISSPVTIIRWEEISGIMPFTVNLVQQQTRDDTTGMYSTDLSTSLLDHYIFILHDSTLAPYVVNNKLVIPEKTTKINISYIPLAPKTSNKETHYLYYYE